MNRCSTKIILRTEQLSKRTGKASISLQGFINGERVVIALGLHVTPEMWDSTREHVLGKSPEIDDMNLIISNCKAKAAKILTDYRLLDVILTADQFRHLYLGTNSREDFIIFYEHTLNLRSKRGEIEHPTYKSHHNTLNKLKAFADRVPFNELTDKWIRQFDTWHHQQLKSKAKKANRPLISDGLNTRHHALKNIRTYVNEALSDKAVRFDDPFRSGMPVQQVKGHITYLNEPELRRFIELYVQGQGYLSRSQQNVLIRFIVSCFTSIRISDNMRLEVPMIKDNCLVFVPHKTRRYAKQIKVPLNDVSQYFLNELFHREMGSISEQKTNQILKVLAGHAGVHKHITSHVARHTFATLFLSRGGQVHVLQAILGHANIKTTMGYVHVIDQDAMLQVQLMESLGVDLIP